MGKMNLFVIIKLFSFLQGSNVQVQVKNGIVYEGVLKTFSPKVSLYAIFSTVNSIIFSAFSISRENNEYMCMAAMQCLSNA